MESTSPAINKVMTSELRITTKYPTKSDQNAPCPPANRGVSEKFLKPVRMSFEFMSSAIKFAAHNVVHGGWYKGNTKAYLSSCAIPERVVDRLYHHLGRLEDSEDTDKATELFEAAAPNVIRQTIVPMFTWIEAGMHHVFHGVVARIMLLMEEVFASEDKKTPFEDLINPYLLGIEELRLDWLHVKTLPKTQWLAEDELGFSRILTFAYGQFFLNIKLKETTNITQGALLSMRQMLIALNVMVALLMSPTDPNVDVIDGHIKVFLSCCHRFTMLYFDGSKEPFWATTCNFPSLLNLPTQISEFGPIRWYWEGSRERYIQTVKKVLISMRKTISYFMRKMVVLQKLITMAWLKDKLRRKERRATTKYTRMYFRYESIEEIKQKVKDGDVISGLTTKIDENRTLEDHFWIVYGKKGNKMNIIPIIRDRGEENNKLLCGMSYQKYRLGDDEDCVRDLTRQELEVLVSDYCVLLPYRENKKSFQRLYGIVFSDWDVIDRNGKKGLPELCPSEFSVDAMSL